MTLTIDGESHIHVETPTPYDLDCCDAKALVPRPLYATYLENQAMPDPSKDAYTGCRPRIPQSRRR